VSEDPVVTIKVRYSCRVCHLVDAVVEVPARTADDENIIKWMNATIIVIGNDHRRRSPQCRPTQLHDVKIPIQGEIVGGATPH
jgi:hypothetical protein